MVLRWLIPLAIAASLNATARESWRWVDDSGTTHYGDTVPERFKPKATKLGPRSAPPTEVQQREASARAARDKAAVEAGARANAALPPARTAAASKPDPATRDLTACEAAKRKFHESAECFGRYRIITGIKPEAFDNCGPEVLPPDCE